MAAFNPLDSLREGDVYNFGRSWNSLKDIVLVIKSDAWAPTLVWTHGLPQKHGCYEVAYEHYKWKIKTGTGVDSTLCTVASYTEKNNVCSKYHETHPISYFKQWRQCGRSPVRTACTNNTKNTIRCSFYCKESLIDSSSESHKAISPKIKIPGASHSCSWGQYLMAALSRWLHDC
jgi:hypothetical protein